MAGKEIKVSKTYKANNGVKLNAQWLKNATRSLGSNASSVLQEISPNIYGVAESVSQIKRTFQRSKVSQNAVTQAIESNRYIKMGRTAIDNAIKDLKSGNFDNSSRSSSNSDDSSTYSFGEINDSDSGSTGQIQVNFNPEGLTSINNAITKQTKFQMQAAKANVDAIVATSSAMMTMNQKNAEASLTMLTNINNSLQAIIKYNNENMSKFIGASMTYYEMMGQVHGPKQRTGEKRSTLSGSDVIDRRGNLNASNLGKLLQQNFKERYAETMPGQLSSMLNTFGDELVTNPLKIVTTTLMKEIIPKSVKEATKSLDKTFGNFITEMIMKTSETLKASEGNFSGLKQFLGSVLDINVKRQDKFNTSGKVTTDAAIFDGITRNAITTEIPKYLRESTSYLRQLVMLNGGDPDKAVANSSIFNRESGTFQRYSDFSKELMGSINESIISSLSNSDFGKSLSRVANSSVISDDKKDAFEALLNKFYLALEKDERTRLDLTKRGPNSDIGSIIGSLTGDAGLKRILEESVYMSFQHGRGGINLNSARLNAKASRNKRISEMEEMNLGELSGLVRHGQTIDEAMASVIYGSDGHATRTTPYTPNSLLGKVSSIFDILERGINVHVTGKTPYRKFKPGSPTSNNEDATPSRSSSSSSSSDSGEMNETELQAQLAEAMDEPRTEAKGKGSKFFANKTEHLGNMMHYILKGDPARVYAEMGAMFGEGITDLGRSMKDAVIAPLKETLFGDRNASITSKVKEMFTELKEDMATFVLGPKNEEGKRTKASNSVRGFLETGLKSWSETLFGPDKSLEDVKEELKKKVQKNADAGLKGAVAGAGLGIASGGLLGTLVGGPLTGALLGTATSILTKSEGFQKLMFGDQHQQLEGKDGKKYDVYKGGLISPQMQKFFKEHKQDMVGSAGIGAIAGTLTGGGLLGSLVGGPVAGALLGTAVGIAKNSDTFKNLIFGKEVGEGDNKKRIGGILGTFNRAFEDTNPKDKTKGNAKTLAARGTVGAGAGLLMSMFTPLGPIGSAALGLAASMVSSKDKFHELLFGSENQEGSNKNEGLLTRLNARISKTVIAPLAGIASDALYDVKDAIVDKVLDPIVNLAEPIAGLTRRIYDRLEEKITGAFDHLRNAFGKVTGGIGKFFQSMLMRIFNRRRKDENRDDSDKEGIFGILSGVLRNSNKKASRKKWYNESYRTTQDFQDKYTKMQSKWEGLTDEQRAQYGDIEDFELEFAENIFFNGGDRRDERLQARQIARGRRISSRQERRDIINREALIADLTRGKYSNTSKEAMDAAMEAYKKTRGYRRGKGMNGISHEDVQRLLTSGGDYGDAIPTSQTIENQLIVEREQLIALNAQLSLLERIEVGISNLGDKLGENITDRISRSHQKRDEKRIGRKIDSYQRSSEMARIASEVNMEVFDDHAEDGYRLSSGFRISKGDLKKIRSIANNPQNPMQSLAQIALDPEASENERKDAYKKITDAWTKKANARKDAREASEQRKADALNARRNFRHLASQYMQTGGRGYATGTGNAKPGDAVVGENGPEIVRFNGGEKVLSNNDLLKVRIVSVDPNAAKSMNDNGTQDVNIIGQTGPIVTYGTAARLDHNTDNKSAIQKALAKKDTLVSYDQIKADNNDLESDGSGSGGGEKQSTWDKLKDALGGLGNILLGGGAIAGLVKLLSNENVQAVLKSMIGVFGQSAETMATVAANDGYEGGTNATTNIKNQVSRWSSLFSDPSKFLLGADGEADSQTVSFLRGGRQILNKVLNGSSGSTKPGLLNAVLHPVKTVKNAVFHPFKTMGNIGSGVKSGFNKAVDAGKGIVDFMKSPHKLDDIKDGLGNLIRKTNASKQVSMIGNLVDNFRNGGGLKGTYDVIKESVEGINPNKTGISGFLTKTADNLLAFGERHGGGVDSIKADVKSMISKIADFGKGKGAKEAGEEAIEAVSKKAATTTVKEASGEVAEAAAEKLAKETTLTTAGKAIKEALEKIGETLSSKYGKTILKTIKSSLKVIDEVIEKITRGLVGKLKNWILKKLAQLATFLGITAGVSATGVGFLGVLAKDGVFLVLGALNSAGKGGTARLFRCTQDAVDGKMQAISAAIGGLAETTVGTVIDIINEIYCAITGDDFISRFATMIYVGISNEEDENALMASQAKLETDWKAYKEDFLQKEYNTYLAENPGTTMSFNDYKNAVANGEIDSDVLGLAEYNDEQNKTFGAKAWDATKKAGNWVKDRYTENWNMTKDAANKFGNWVSSGWNKLTGGGKGGAGNGAVPFYSQKDPRWGNMVYSRGGSGESMSEIGCGPTAFAMAASGATGRNIDPIQAAGAMQKVGARDNTGTNWGGIGKAADMYGINTRMQQNPSGAFIDSELDAGNPVILSGRSGGYGTPYTPQGHYVVATGRDNNGNYIINDPNRLGGSRKYKKSDMLAETGAAWGFGGRGPETSTNTTVTTTQTSTGTGVTPQDVINVASNEVGYLEKASASDLYSKTGNAGKGNFTKYAVDVGHANGQYWCATFVSWCLYTAANKNRQITNKLLFGNMSAACETLRQQFIKASRYSKSNPQPGDLIFFETSNPGKSNHIGIVVNVANGKVYTIEGNTSSENKVVPNGGAVAAKSYDITNAKILGYGRPLYDGASNFAGVTDSYSDATTTDVSSATSTTSTSGGDFFSKISTFFQELGSRATAGLTTGNWNKDWSGVFGNNASTSADVTTTDTSTSDASVVADSSVKGTSSAKKLWDLLRSKGLSEAGTAGVLGNLFAESGLRTNNVQNSYEKKVGSDTEYTTKVDNGSYTNFAKDAAGYGLAQWTYHSRKQALLDLAKRMGKSVADEDVQTTHLINELSQSYGPLLTNLKSANSVKSASDAFMLQFERPKDQSTTAMNKRAGYAQSYYNQYATGAGYGGKGGATSTGVVNHLANNRVINSTNGNSGDVSAVINYLSQILSVLGESSDKLNALEYLKSISKSSGNNVVNNQYYSQTTNNSSTGGASNLVASKTDTNKFATHQRIASGGL